MLEPEHPVHGRQDDLEDLTEIEGGRDLGGDLLDDADVVRALGEVVVEPVDRLLVTGDLLAKPVGILIVRAHPRVGPKVSGRLVGSATAGSARRASS